MISPSSARRALQPVLFGCLHPNRINRLAPAAITDAKTEAFITQGPQ
jgi:hypothetical protein